MSLQRTGVENPEPSCGCGIKNVTVCSNPNTGLSRGTEEQTLDGKAAPNCYPGFLQYRPFRSVALATFPRHHFGQAVRFLCPRQTRQGLCHCVKKAAPSASSERHAASVSKLSLHLSICQRQRRKPRENDHQTTTLTNRVFRFSWAQLIPFRLHGCRRNLTPHES